MLSRLGGMGLSPCSSQNLTYFEYWASDDFAQ
jgi:hypothetical protein